MQKTDYKNYRDKMAETEKPAMCRCNFKFKNYGLKKEVIKNKRDKFF